MKGYLHFQDIYCVKECPLGYSQYGVYCVLDCPLGYRKLNGTCISCPKGCSRCNEFDLCLECNTNLYLYEGRCHEKCPTKTFETDESCELCPDENCQECGMNGLCVKCKSGTIPYQSRCIESCKSLGLFQWNHKCVTICPLDTVAFLENNTCLMRCPAGWFRNEMNECARCPNDCDHCLEAESCIICKKGFYMLHDLVHGHKCVNECPTGGIINGVCGNCSPGCQSCQLEKEYACLGCKSTHDVKVLENQSMCPICGLRPIKYAKNFRKSWSSELYYHTGSVFALSEYAVIYNFPFKCSLCDENCEKCSENGYCEVCKQGFFRNHLLSCSSQCPKGYFPDSSERRCLRCRRECQACESWERCTECNTAITPSIHFTSGNCSLLNTKGTLNDIRRRIGRYALSIPYYPNPRLQIEPIYVFELCPEEFDCKSCKNQYFLNCLSVREFCNQNCKSFMGCHGSCEQCDQMQCFKCSSLYTGMIINGTRCICPTMYPYLDRKTNSCVKTCPNSMKIIEETMECVEDCLWESIYLSDPIPFSFNNTCRKSCPSGTMIVADYGLYDSLRCLPISTHSQYLLIMSKLNDTQGDESLCSNQELVNNILAYFQGLQGDSLVESIYHNSFKLISEFLECTSYVEAELISVLADILYTRSPLCYTEEDFYNFKSASDKLLSLSKELQLPQSTSFKLLRLLIDITRCLYYLSSTKTMKILEKDNQTTSYIIRDYMLKEFPKHENSKFIIHSTHLNWDRYLFSFGFWEKTIVEHLYKQIEIVEGPIVFMGNEYDEEKENLIVIEFKVNATEEATEIKCLLFESSFKISAVDPQRRPADSLLCPYKVGSLLFLGRYKMEYPGQNMDVFVFSIIVSLTVIVILGTIICTVRKKKMKLAKSSSFKQLEISTDSFKDQVIEDKPQMEVEEKEEEADEEEEEEKDYLKDRESE